MSSINEELVNFYELYPKYTTASEDVNFLEAIFDFYDRNPERILDFACGTGRHVNLLDEKYEAIGTDLSPSMIDYAKSTHQGEYQVQDMRNLNLENTVDIAFTFFASVGNLVEDEDMENMLESVDSVLNENGLLIFDDAYWLTQIPEEKSERQFNFDKEREGKSLYIGMDIQLEDFGFSQTHSHTYFASGKEEEKYERYDEKVELRRFRPSEIERFLKDKGFELLNIFKNKSLNEYEGGRPTTVTFVARNDKPLSDI